MVLGKAELGDARQRVPSEDMEVATGTPGSVSTGPGQEEAAVLGGHCYAGGCGPRPKGRPSTCFPCRSAASS